MSTSNNKMADIVHLMTGGALTDCPSVIAGQVNINSSEQATAIPSTWEIHSDTRATDNKIVLKKAYGSRTIYCMLWQNGTTYMKVLFSQSSNFVLSSLYTKETTLPANVADAGVTAMSNTISYQSITVIDRPGFFAILPNGSAVTLCQVTEDDPAYANGEFPFVVYETITTAGRTAAYYPNSVSIGSATPIAKSMQLKHSFGWREEGSTAAEFSRAGGVLAKDILYYSGDGSTRIPLASFGFCGYPVSGGWNTPISNVFITASLGAQSGFVHNGTIYKFNYPGFLIPYE